MKKTCLFVGPDRAGKTWFIGGTEYSLEAAAIDSEENQTTNPKLNQPLKQLSNIFKIEDFDQQLPTVHNPDEFDFLQFNLNQQGLIRQQQTTVNTVDYAGEHITNIITEPERAYDRFRREWDFETVPSFEKLMERDSSGDIDAHQIPVLLSVLAHEADLLALVLPMDDFAEGLSKEELPAHLDQDQLETR
ncbi:hypothetical protein [Halonotius sp. GCM10025705]|uniref:hypothetical protein n=1 Tax=Halonotius sp. GCM10025705 TaxID=3252678 RepID=UPI0036211F93